MLEHNYTRRCKNVARALHKGPWIKRMITAKDIANCTRKGFFVRVMVHESQWINEGQGDSTQRHNEAAIGDN